MLSKINVLLFIAVSITILAQPSSAETETGKADSGQRKQDSVTILNLHEDGSLSPTQLEAQCVYLKPRCAPISSNPAIPTTSTSIVNVETRSNPSCRHQKTINRLPPGAPLPDYDVSLSDDITAKEAFAFARKFQHNDLLVEATEYYERAVGALRREKSSKKMERKIVSTYARLLRQHPCGASRAEALEREFLKQ